MKNLLSLRTLAAALAVCSACVSQAQDLFRDFSRYAITDSQSPAPQNSDPAFRYGYVDYRSQPLALLPLQAFQENYGIFESGTSAGNSAIYFDFDAKSYQFLGYNSVQVNLPASSVLLANIDHDPSVEIDLPKDSGNTATVTTSVGPNGTGFTAGNMVILSLVNGKWTTLAVLPISASKTDTRSISLSSKTRLRWTLERTSGSEADSTLEVVIAR